MELEDYLKNFQMDVIKIYRKQFKIFDLGYNTSNLKQTFFMSEDSLASAVKEMALDLRVMFARRSTFKLLSKGKTAGIIIFRLSRWSIIHTSNPLHLKDPMFKKIHFLIAVNIGLLFAGMYAENLNKQVRTEILYTLMYRHVNQETLGIVIDTLRLENP